jgi:hypothetical protein
MELFSGEETVADGELVIGLRVRCLGKEADRALGRQLPLNEKGLLPGSLSKAL